MMVSSRHRHQRTQGNTLVEYALGTVVTVAMLVTSLTSIDVPQLLEDIMTDTMNGSVSGGTLSVRSYGAPMLPSSLPQSLIDASGRIPEPMAGQEQVCFDSNICVNIPVIDGPVSTETSGSNGSELLRQMASTFDQMALQLRASQTNDSYLIWLVEKMANAGHGIADHVGDAPDPDAFTTMDISGALVTYSDTQWRERGILHNLRALSYYKNLMDGHLTNHPEIQQTFQGGQALIHQESDNINTIASTVEFQHYYAGNESAGGEVLIHQSSNTICGTVASSSCWWRGGGNSSYWQLASNP